MVDNPLITPNAVGAPLPDSVETVQSRSRNAVGEPSDNRADDWFLPESSSALREITAPDASGAGLSDVDAISDRILSHIRA